MAAAGASSVPAPATTAAPAAPAVVAVAERAGGVGKRSHDRYATVKHLVAGGVAGAVSRTSVAPLERMKILFQIQLSEKPVYRGVVACLRTIGKEEGVMGFFKGNGTNVVRMVPYSAVQFAAYERYKKALVDENGRLTTPRRLLAGAMAGITSVGVTYPLDVIRTRLSAQDGARLLKYHGISHAFSTILKQDGVRALYGGLIATLLGVAPYVALNFTCYETLKLFTGEGHLERMNPATNDLVTSWKLLCGALAGAIAQTCTYPLDLVRRRMQMRGVEGFRYYHSTTDAFRTIMRVEGIAGFYKGMLPNYLKVMPSISISFVVYEWTKEQLAPL